MYSTDIKKCARQIVKESLNRILAGSYEIPSLEEMKLFLEQNFDHSFDEYLLTQKIKRSHPTWSSDQVVEELDRQKRHYENELRVNVRIAALNTIEEIENLNPNSDLILEVGYSNIDEDTVRIKSSLEREIAYNIEHAIHHMAIIKIAVMTVFPKVQLAENFGIAYSTVRYHKTNSN